ncbi:SDR family NAD(P)-dependent oxidoreductase [Beggiatoa leptomitoformis]|uniref:SDR family NAD(P)-dependent oxidoreductase n=1 Tax=Beggiatoa leptomitoformis TaxID=288004 RepID=A0A2N9YI24_9GAMM|nr:SDR family NAD(P)-dependent oxidoreductase [Beggiatoa leptomitoformis]ALG67717.1 SDR family NAD(P)-dependent oxidoreductase [Beggiatoa leptomitoformis]AUI70045.1 SDR family NAD(P)-dependent oxidoreductase [Beggiatoa leptomitoformis]
MQIQGNTAIVTGAGSGMGAATARALAQAGAKVALLDINHAAAQQVADEIGGIAIHCDVSSADSAVYAIQQAREAFGVARICVNCAGILLAARIVGKTGALPLETFSRVININLVGTFNIMRLVAANLMETEAINASGERGIIINTASVAAFEGQIGQAAYSASKGGVVSLGLPAAREFAKFGIRVMTIAPGLVETPMLGSLSEEAQASLAASVPFPARLCRPDEYASLALCIIQNEMLNGEVIRLDGAIRLQIK